METIVIYYDFEPAYGVNATCVLWPCRNEYFSSWSDFISYVSAEYPCFELVEITSDNYPLLCAQGVFGNGCD